MEDIIQLGKKIGKFGFSVEKKKRKEENKWKMQKKKN